MSDLKKSLAVHFLGQKLVETSKKLRENVIFSINLKNHTFPLDFLHVSLVSDPKNGQKSDFFASDK